MSQFKFEKVIPSKVQIDELYQQLRLRNHKISHISTPKYEIHEQFVTNHPYREWFIIKKMGVSIDNIYIQNDNSIGLNFIDDISELQIKMILTFISTDFQPLEAIPSVRSNNFFINVASSDIELQKKLKNLGLVENQRSFVFEK